MSAAQAALAVLVAAPVLGFAGLLWWTRSRPRNPAAVTGFHAAPVYQLTVDEAYELMQRHQRCSVIDCPAKEAARTVLAATQPIDLALQRQPSHYPQPQWAGPIGPRLGS
ncbi:hypothetical protein [Nocardia asteroides]|uniref:hypothetical protein n=1 Tax=Nocardia asteroides TaxID=1824 RepID=UPI001E449B92|nr:hypothetical protein [Nocardia asteroides]UGT59872.1 hypothetical protein LTT61_21950 [Nocardia asteroides]